MTPALHLYLIKILFKYDPTAPSMYKLKGQSTNMQMG